jgi:hypothetical protein
MAASSRADVGTRLDALFLPQSDPDPTSLVAMLELLDEKSAPWKTIGT